MDRVRIALFSMLGQDFTGCRVLDLYAGSGAYGLEALSRGADEVVFVEKNGVALEGLRINLQKSKLTGGRSVKGGVEGVLGRVGCGFNLVIADPPYDRAEPGTLDVYRRLLEHPAWGRGLLAGEGILVMEGPGEAEPPRVAPWDLVDVRRYGATGLWFYRRLTSVTPGDG